MRGWLGLALSLAASGRAFAVPALTVASEVADRVPVQVTVRGAPPGDAVVLLGTRDGLGLGPCRAGQCLDLHAPVVRLADPAVVAADGTVTFWPALPGPGVVHLQAVVGGGPYQLSPPARVRVRDGDDDPDGDGVINRFEHLAGTDMTSPDTDADGVPDGEDPFPLRPHAVDVWVPYDQTVSDPRDSLPDPEFDPVGLRVVWAESDGAALWVAGFEPLSGRLQPLDGRGELVDTGVLPIGAYRNGPEWVQTARGAEVLYGREVGGQDVVVRATRTPTGWTSAPLGEGFLAFGSQEPLDPDPRVFFGRRVGRGDTHAWSLRLDVPGSAVDWGIDLRNARFVSGGPGFVALGRFGPTEQVVHADPLTGVLTHRTSSPSFKRHTFGWYAPELGGAEVFLVGVGPPGWDMVLGIEIWADDGQGGWRLVDTVRPPPAWPFVVSPEPFVVDGRSFVSFLASDAPENRDAGRGEIWIVDIDPSVDFARRVSDGSVPVMKDPEPVVLGLDAWVFYSEVAGSRRVLHRCLTGL